MKRLTFAIAVALIPLLPGAAMAAPPVTLEPVLGATDWIGGRVDARALRGKVVLVDVFTFGCYNCANVTPNLRALHRSAAADLVIVGIHSPETPYERERSNVVRNLARLGITWSVAIDNDFALWRAYGVDAWPTQLIFDRHGVLRKTIVGDSQDAEVDATIKELVAEK